MQFGWDANKSAANQAKHDIAFAEVADFRWDTAQIFADERRDYGEERQFARGMIGERLFVIVFVLRGDTTRLISLRKANRREQALYVTENRKRLRDT